MENILINDDFGRSVKRLRSILPKLSFGLLIATYLISALIMGIFHAQKANNIGFMIAAFLIPLAIQAGRGTLVFFFQLNPAQILGRMSFGIIAATVLLVLSMIEAILVLLPYGYSWIISVCTLMLIGWVIEVMILRETIFATQLELFQDQEKWEELKNFYLAKNELQKFADELKQGVTSSLTESENQRQLQEKYAPDVVLEKDTKGDTTLEELKTLLVGKTQRSSLNGMEKGKK
ncbi:MAG: hypothetical protein Sapg2KO_25010 [Saprospiraceae bacterium]